MAIKSYGRQREVFGFGSTGSVYIFDYEPTDDIDIWFAKSACRYSVNLGWYAGDFMTLPEELPFGVRSVELPWEMVGDEDGYFKSDNEVRQAVDKVLYAETCGSFVGEIGERLDLNVIVYNLKVQSNQYGKTFMIYMTDDKGNKYLWITAAKSWPIGTHKHIRGTVKGHEKVKRDNITILTRCMEVK